MKRRRKRVRSIVRRGSDQFLFLMTGAAALGLFAFVLCLEAIGPPPRWRIDALWVYGHLRSMRIMIAGLLIAAAATCMVFLLRGRNRRRRRSMIVLLWMAAIVACAAVYWDRVPIIYSVVMKYAW